MNKTHRLCITNISSEGFGQALFSCPNGKGEMQEKGVLVPYTLVGETVEAEVRRHKNTSGINHLGLVSAIETPSPLRVSQRCKHFGSCGGCVFQHMPYEQQLAFKEQKIRKQFEALPSEDIVKTTFS